jgi:hypothetical protein
LAQTIINTYLALEQRDLFREIKTQIGIASQVAQVAGAANVLQGLASGSAGSTSNDTCTGLGAMSYDGNKLFRTIGECIIAPDGSAVNRKLESYRKFEAAHQAVANYLALLKDTEARRHTVLDGIKATTEAIQKAPDLVSVQKLQAIASTQIAALNAIDGERSTALGAVLVQSLDNTTDESKQEQARKEERSVDFQAASKQFAQFLTPIEARPRASAPSL